MISFPSKKDKFLDFIFNASKTFLDEFGITGFNRIDILAICVKLMYKILFKKIN